MRAEREHVKFRNKFIRPKFRILRRKKSGPWITGMVIYANLGTARKHQYEWIDKGYETKIERVIKKETK